jgi:oligoribonuclease (3'-5' exoribonuclease)
MNSPYISIDIETTGRDPERHQVLEIGAVYNNQGASVMDCPTFEAIVNPGEIVGTPFALNMNARLLRRIANGEGDPPGTVMAKLMDWVHVLHGRRRFGIDRFHLIGKNVGAFDLQFLKRMPGWEKNYFSHRHLEVGSLFSTREGMDSQSDLYAAMAADSNIEGAPHEALYDARVSLELARQFWRMMDDPRRRPSWRNSEETT